VHISGFSLHAPYLKTCLVSSGVILRSLADWIFTTRFRSGGRRQVLEDGRDVCHSESDSENEEHGDVLIGAYKGAPVDKDGNPIGTAHKLANEQANAMRASARCSEEFQGSFIQSPPERARSPTPVNSDDDGFPTEDQKRQQASALRKAQKATT
jgi:hypothetical protein